MSRALGLALAVAIARGALWRLHIFAGASWVAWLYGSRGSMAIQIDASVTHAIVGRGESDRIAGRGSSEGVVG
jgi:hypothetical protein